MEKSMDSWYTLIPPLLAITFAIVTRRIILSLFLGVLVGEFISSGTFYSSFSGAVERLVTIFQDGGHTRTIFFSLLIGGFLQVVHVSGGVQGFIRWMSNWSFTKSKRKSGLFAIAVGSFLFIESNISILTVGTIFRPIFKKLKISFEKLAYIADSSCAPMKVLLPINAWGAYLVTQIQNNGVSDATSVFTQSMTFFIYPLLSLLIVLIAVLGNVNLGPMKKFELEAAEITSKTKSEKIESESSLLNFILPMIILVCSVLFFMYVTGEGDMRNGSGSKSVLYGVLFTLIISFFLYLFQGLITAEEYMKNILLGMGRLLEISLILLMSFAINSICKELGTGVYVASIFNIYIEKEFVPVLLFLFSSFVSFSTGTSWGTFAVMLGISIPVAGELGIPLPLVIGAVVSGGIWGDHSSPISDTTVISSLASGSSHINHVKSQLPYAFIGGFLTLIIFLILGLLL